MVNFYTGRKMAIVRLFTKYVLFVILVFAVHQGFAQTPPGQALALNGNGQYVTMTMGGNTLATEYTVEAWVRPLSTKKTMTIFSTRGSTGSNSTDVGFDMKLQGGNTIHADIPGYNSASKTYGWATTAADLTYKFDSGHWYHIAYQVSVSGGFIKIYVNGLLGTTITANFNTSGIPYNNSNLFDGSHGTGYIGSNRGNNTAEDFTGDIDELKIYNASNINIATDAVSTALNGAAGYYQFENSLVTLGPAATNGSPVGAPVYVQSYAMGLAITGAPTISSNAQGFTANITPPLNVAVSNYYLDVSTDPNFGSLVINKQKISTGTAVSVTGLAAGTQYYYRVCPNNTALEGQGAYSSAAGFYTMAITYPAASFIYAVGTPVNITPLSVMAIPAGGCSLSPALPAGLSFNTSTGVISGTPAAASVPTTYAITAPNTIGSYNNIQLATYAFTPQGFGYNHFVNDILIKDSTTGALAPAFAHQIGIDTTLAANLYNPWDAAVDAAGNIYVAEQTSVTKTSATGVSVTINGLANNNGGYNKLAVDGAGNLYVLDGAARNIKKIAAADGAITTIGTGLDEPSAVTADAAGNLYVLGLLYHITANGTEQDTGIVVKISAANGAITTVASGFLGFLLGRTELFWMAADAAGNVFLYEPGNHAIKKIAAADGAVTTLATGGTIRGLATDIAGNVYYGDVDNGRIVILGGAGYQVIGTQTENPSYLNGLAVDAAGAIYHTSYILSTQGNGYGILKKVLWPTGSSVYSVSPALPAGLLLNTSTGAISGTPTTLSAQTSYTITAATTGRASATVQLGFKVVELPPGNFNYTAPGLLPTGSAITPLLPQVAAPATTVAYNGFGKQGLAVTTAGEIYIGDGAASIAKISGVGSYLYSFQVANNYWLAFDTANKLYASSSDAFVHVYTEGTNIRTISGLGNSKGVAVDTAGNVYVADQGREAVAIINAAGAITYVGAGALAGRLDGMAVDVAGNIFVAGDSLANISRISAVTRSTSIVASGLHSPAGVTIDAYGNLYVADDNAVKKIRGNDGAVLTIGTGLNNPRGIAVNALGDVYVADAGNLAVKKIYQPGGAATAYAISPALPAGLLFNTATGAITGTPLTASALANYTITASNSAGTRSVVISLGVKWALTTAVYVDGNAGSDANSGSSWANAFKTLGQALQVAAANSITDSILIAKGIYYPVGTTDATVINNDSSFVIPRNGIRLYGGYNATTGVRNLTNNPVYLDGDGVAYHVLVVAGIGAGDSVIVDGLNIRSGNARGTVPHTYSTQTQVGKDGGGVLIINCYKLGTKLLFKNCAFTGNSALNYGAGFYNNLATPSLINCLFANNYNTSFGGSGMYNNILSPVISNCTFADNISASGPGAAIYNSSFASALVINNSIVWGNGTSNGANNSGIASDASLLITGSNNIIQAGPGGSSTADPLFASTIVGNYQLTGLSPAIGAGSNALYTGNINTDVDLYGRQRLAGIIDIGAYEAPLQANTLDKVNLTAAAPASPAYSLRLLSSTYNGYAIKVRNGRLGTFMDIGFANGDLDTAILKTFVGSDTGYVATWYDQGGFVYNATQASKALQPRIATAGKIERVNGKPAIYFGTGNLATGKAVLFTTGASMVGVAKGNSTTPSAFVTKTGTADDKNLNYPGPFDFTNSGGSFSVGNAATQGYNVINLSNTSPKSYVGNQLPAAIFGFVVPNTGNYYTYLNSIKLGSSGGNSFLDNGNALRIGNRNDSNSTGNLWTPEVILFNAALDTATRNTLEASQKVYYVNDDDSLAALSTTAGSITPGFLSSVATYNATAATGTASVTVTATPEDANATMLVNINGGGFSQLAGATASTNLALNVGKNTIIVQVAAQNTTTVKTYSIIVTRPVINALDKTGLTSTTPSSPAYSLRLLSSAYTGKAINVRNSRLGSFADIGFTAVGDLDTTALKTFVGSDTGYIATLYDQSGFGYDMHQATTTLQPRIIAAGKIERVNSRPAIYFGTSNMATDKITMFTAGASMVGVGKGDSSVASSFITKTGSADGKNLNYPAPFDFTNSAGSITVGNASGPAFNSVDLGATSPKSFVNKDVPVAVHSFTIPASGAGNWANYLNGTQLGTPLSSVMKDDGNALMIGNRADGNGSGRLWVSEMALFNSVLSTADRQTLESSQKIYYINSDAMLSSLTTTAGSLSPVFAAATTAYTVTTAQSTATITPTPTDVTATVQVKINSGSYVAVANGTASPDLPLNTGSNTVTILVTAQDGTTTNTYTITILRQANLAWTGAVSTAWATAGNWDGNIVPTLIDDVTIPSTPTNQPTVSAAAIVHSITIAGAARLTVAASGLLSIAGNVTNTGMFNASEGSIILDGTTAQTITGSVAVNNFTVNNTQGVTISSGTAKVYGLYTPTAGTLTTNGNLTLASTANGTASVAASTVANYVTGNVTVERYIPAHRAWRLLTAPLSNTGTIYQNWQNNGVATDSTGALIFSPAGTGYANGTGNGLTKGGVAPSIETYDPVANSWVGLTNTTPAFLSGNGMSAANIGIGLFVTGPYGSSNIAASTGATATTLRAAGSLQTGTQQFNYTNLTAGTYIMVANPYASPLIFTQIGAIGAAAGNISNTMWAWDAQRKGTSYGGYVTFSWDAKSGSYDQDISSDSTAQTMAIQSGEAFFVQAVGNGNAAVTINETDKASTSAITGGVFGLQPVATPAQQIRISLNRGTEQVDGVLVKFGDAYKTGVNDDATKLFNYDENLSLRIDTNYLAIERRPIPAAGDTIYLDAYALRKNTAYSLTASPQNMPTGLQPWLVDAYTNTKTPLSTAGGTNVSFNTSTDAGSLSETRFVIVFQTNSVLATATTIKAVAAATGVQVEWTTPNELDVKQYLVQRSADAQNFNSINTAMARNSGNKEVYDYTDAQPNTGDNYYRIEISNGDGTVTFSNVVLVKMQKGAAIFSIYPNPTARNRQVHVQFANMSTGKYALVLYSTSGKQLMDETIQLDGTTATTLYTISLPQGIASGSYRIVLLDGNGGEWKQQLLVQ